MKDWYCNPDSFEEAVEIVDRAVANGAKKDEYPSFDDEHLHGIFWQDFDSWGVIKGSTYTGPCSGDSAFSQYNAEQLTIQQVRERFPLPSDKKEWNGSWLPPVGFRCEIRPLSDSTEYKWLKCVRHHSVGDIHFIEIIEESLGVVIKAANDIYGSASVSGYQNVNDLRFRVLKGEFRKIKSKRDKWIEAAVNRGIYESDAEKLYDAMISGDIPIPEVK